MQLTEGGIYHIYNRGINKQIIFSSPGNYIYFLGKVRKHLLPVCDILCYCLMPNHFHFLIHANEKSILPVKTGAVEMQLVSASVKHWLSSYTKGYNKMYGRTGSLFVQNTHCKQIVFDVYHRQGSFACFNYIHQNLWKSGMVAKIEDWRYSSFNDYVGLRNGTLCNQKKAYELLALQKEVIYKESYGTLDPEKIRKLLF
jgi:REP element-mobilizing transposase RayT